MSTQARALGVLAITLAGCSGVAEVGEAPSWRGPERERSTGSAPGAGGESGSRDDALSVQAGPEAAAYYNAAEPPTPRASERSAVAAGAIADVADDLGARAPERDGRLDRAAAALAEVAPAQAPVPYSLIEFALNAHGIIEPSPHLVVLWGSPGDAAALEDELRSRLPPVLESAEFSRVGVGYADRGGGRAATVIALQTSHVETAPIPRARPEGGAVRVEGRVRAPFSHPEVYVTRADGSVVTAPVRRAGADEFRADVDCGASGGRTQIEIIARDQRGSSVLANFPVWCGAEPPAAAELQSPAGEPAPETPASAEEAIARLINRERERHGLSPLGVDDGVAEVARAHAREMAETGVVAHVSPETGSAADRVAAAEIRTPVVLENVARAYTVREAHEGLMNSPGHRAGILHEGVTHVGVGVAFGDEVGDHREIFVGQVFVRRGGEGDARASTERLHDAVQDARRLAADPALARIAHAYARDLAAGASREEAAAAAERRLAERAYAFSSVSSVAEVVPHVSQFSVSSTVERADATHYGVGVVPTGETHPGREFAVVLLLGRR